MPPGVEVRRELVCEADDIVPGLPIYSRCNSRKTVRRVPHECDRLGSNIQHCSDQGAGSVLCGNPLEIVRRTVVRDVLELRSHSIERGAGHRRYGRTVQICVFLGGGEEPAYLIVHRK
jgi:hypothetical protein